MWALLKSLLAKWAIFKLLLRTLGSLAWLIPIAFLLKAIGLPVLILLLVLAVPILIVLAMIGLPIILVVILGGAFLSLILALLSLGFAALKIALPILIIIWLVQWLTRSRPSDTPPMSDRPGAPPA